MSVSDSWETPQWLFDLLNEEFNFLIDSCATNENSKCEYLFKDALKKWDRTLIDNIYCNMEYLENVQLENYAVFMNPPYSNPGPFLERAWEFSKHMRVVCLVRDDPSTKWYQGVISKGELDGTRIMQRNAVGTTYWDGKESFGDLYEGNIVQIIRLPKRLKFERDGVPGGTYNFPVCIIVMDRREHEK